MKFCVFGYNKKPKYLKSRHNLSINPMSFEESAKIFNALCNSEKYKYLYFLVDFGEADDIPFYKKVDMWLFGTVTLPWLMISGIEDGETLKVVDSIELEFKGFTEEYQSIYKGIERFCHILSINYKCNLYIKLSDESKDRFYVTNTNRLYNRMKHDKCKYCRYYK